MHAHVCVWRGLSLNDDPYVGACACLALCPSVCLSVCLSVCTSACICRFVCLFASECVCALLPMMAHARMRLLPSERVPTLTPTHSHSHSHLPLALALTHTH
jgi:hypothetical protein